MAVAGTQTASGQHYACFSHCKTGARPSGYGSIANDHNLPGQPMTGTLAECVLACDKASSCVAFSRAAAVNSNTAAPCYLKRQGPLAKDLHRSWLLFVVRCPTHPGTTACTARLRQSSAKRLLTHVAEVLLLA